MASTCANSSYLSIEKGSNCGVFHGGVKHVTFNKIVQGESTYSTLPLQQKAGLLKMMSIFLRDQAGLEKKSYQPFIVICGQVGVRIVAPGESCPGCRNMVFDNSLPEFIVYSGVNYLLPWKITHIVDFESLKSPKDSSRELRPSAGQALHYANSLLRRTPESLRHAVVICHVHPNRGIFYRVSRTEKILCTEISGFRSLADALLTFLTASPMSIGFNVMPSEM